MEKREITEEIQEVRNKILTVSSDSHFTEKLLEKYDLLKKQKNNVEVILDIRKEDIVKEYDFSAYKIIKCKTCYLFKTGGYIVVIKPFCKSVYEHLDTLTRMKDEYETFDDKKKELFDSMVLTTISFFDLPLVSFLDEDFMFETAEFLISKKMELFKKYLDVPLKEETEEDIIANHEFEEAEKMMEEMRKEAENA